MTNGLGNWIISRGFDCWQLFRDGLGLLDFCAGDQDDRCNDDRAAREDVMVYTLVQDKPSEEDSNDWIDVGVGSYL